MEYRVEELAARAGVRVDTVRYYQARGLLPAPRREGRIALYSADHLARLRRIRALLQDGFSLSQIRTLLDRGGRRGASALLTALVEESVGGRTLSLQELASEAGVPPGLLNAGRDAGLLEPVRSEGEELFSESDLEMVRAGLALLDAGLPLRELLDLASRHATHVQDVSDAAIELFDRHVRKAGDPDDDAVAEAFRTLLPSVTRLVALHFQRTLVNRALRRLAAKGDRRALQAALSAAESARLEVAWR